MPESLDFLKTSVKSPVDSLKKVVNQYRLSFIFAAAALVLLIFGAWQAKWLLGLWAGNSGVVVFEGSNRAGIDGEDKDDGGEIVVDVAGAVVNAGVYTLAANSRLKDALAAAGGLSVEADRDWIGRRLNLASPLIDGAKVYIPSREEVKDGQMEMGTGTGMMGEIGDEQGLININTASPSQLESLAGIGPVTAGKIIDGRPYAAIEDLLNHKILGVKTFEKLKDKLTVY